MSLLPHFSPSICHDMVGPYAMILVFMLSFNPAFSLSSLTLIKGFFSSSLLLPVRAVPSTNLRASLIAQLVKNPPAMQETSVRFLGRKIHWRSNRLSSQVFLGFPCGSAGNEFACSMGDLGSILGLGRSPGEDKGYPLQCFGLENFIYYTVHGVSNSQTQLSEFHFHII